MEMLKKQKNEGSSLIENENEFTDIPEEESK